MSAGEPRQAGRIAGGENALRDRDIRQALRHDLEAKHGDCRETVIIDEFCVGEREARVDLAVVNGRLDGFEIKSPGDSLARLPRQRDIYNLVFDRVTVVCARKHLGGVRALVPRWWGLQAATVVDDQVVLQRVRRARENPAPDPLALAQLLWRDEVLALLECEGGVAGVKSKPKRILWQVAADRIPPQRLGQLVRDAIRARGDWRSARRPELGDGVSQPSARS